MSKIAVFIDRDGTINQESGYIDCLDRFHILPKVPEAIQRLNESGIPAIMVTNQSGVARGYFTMNLLGSLHEKMNKELGKGGSRLDGIYICPHHPDEDCACRKPKPGMLLRAAREMGITLHRSYVIGDKMIDIRLAHSVGAKGILVLTGYGAEEIRTVAKYLHDKPDHVAANLYEAVNWVLKNIRSQKLPPPLPSPLKGEGEVESQQPEPRRILIVKPSSLGDIVHTLPVLWLLRKIYPDAHIGWVVKEDWSEILAGNPLLDEVVILKKGVKGLLSAIRHTRQNISPNIRRKRYDTIIDLQGLFRSGIISLLSGANERIGFSNAREFAYLFYNRKTSVPREYMHAVDRYLLTVNIIAGSWVMGHGSSQFPLTLAPLEEGLKPHFPLYIEIEDSEWAKEFLLKHKLYNTRPIIAINPSARWEKKRWSAHSYAALINQLIQEVKAGIIIIGSKEDIPVAEEISSLIHGISAVAAGKTSIKTLIALLGRVDLLVTNDSGPMHIAAALGTPVVALFGPTDPRLTGPYGDGHTVIRKDMECSPCLRRPCRHGRPLCMEAVTVEEVAEAVKNKISHGGFYGD